MNKNRIQIVYLAEMRILESKKYKLNCENEISDQDDVNVCRHDYDCQLTPSFERVHYEMCCMDI